MPKMIEISAAEYERLRDCIREDGMRIAALIEENKALHQDVKCPTAVDAAPVVHGRWIWDEEAYSHECSECHCQFDYYHTYSLFDNGYEYATYCPNCGAKMDGEGKSK